MDADPTPSPARRHRAMAAALILPAAIAAAYLLVPPTLGEQARRFLLAELQRHYAGCQVSIGSGRYSREVGLIFEDLRFVLPSTPGSTGRPLLRIARLIVETDLQVDKILSGEVPLRAKRVIASDVEIDAWPDQHGEWSVARLWPPPQMGPGCPRFEVRNSRLRVHRGDDSINAVEKPPRPLELDRLQLAVDVAPEAAGEEPTHRFSLRASSEFAGQVSLAGVATNESLQLHGAVRALRIDPVLTIRLPSTIPHVTAQLKGLTALGDLQFAARRNPGQPIDFLAKWNCHEGRYEHPSLPQSIENLQGVVSLRPQGLTIEAAQGTLGEALCRVSGSTQGWSADSDVSFRLIASNLMLNERIGAALPLTAQRLLDRIRPRGQIDIDSRLDRNRGSWIADAVIDLHGIDISADKFPYPLTQVIGKVHFRDSQVWSERLSGRIGTQRINLAFTRSNLGSLGAVQPSWVRISTDGPIAIDSTLLNSLTSRGEPRSKLESFVRTLSPRGSVHLVSGEWTTSPTGEKSQRIDLRINGGSLRYSGFPYALYDVTGQVLARDDTISLLNFSGKNSDNASITCEGTFENLTKNAAHRQFGDWRVGLHFQATDLPLDETIRAALPKTSQQTWDSLAPGGILDHLDVQVSHADAFPSPQLIVAARQQARRTVDSRTVSLRPTMLPYRLDIMEGAVRFDGDQVTIESLDARHDATRLNVNGHCNQAPSGQWRLNLNVHSGSRLHPDPELINSLPAQVRGTFHRLQLRGPLNVRGATSMMLPDAQHPDATIDWRLTVQLEGNRIGDVGPVRDLRGEIAVQGRSNGLMVTADGTVNIDSLHVDDKQVTSIRGPFAVRDDRLLLGEAIAVIDDSDPAALSNSSISPIEGRLFGGTASLSGDVVLSSGNFDVIIAIRDGDVATLLADLGETHSTVVGKFDGRTHLEGTVGASHLLKGTGSGQLSGANLYQLPILVQVFNMLRVKPSEAVAFTDGEVRFSIYGDNVTFNQMQLWGDLIALHGSGTMNRAREVDLSFNTRVSPHNGWSQVTRHFGENQYTLWTISVKGPLSDPVIERRTLDTVNDTLERLFPGIAEPVQPRESISTQLDQLRHRFVK